jgi:hypothetical protein
MGLNQCAERSVDQIIVFHNAAMRLHFAIWMKAEDVASLARVN